MISKSVFDLSQTSLVQKLNTDRFKSSISKMEKDEKWDINENIER